MGWGRWLRIGVCLSLLAAVARGCPGGRHDRPAGPLRRAGCRRGGLGHGRDRRERHRRGRGHPDHARNRRHQSWRVGPAASVHFDWDTGSLGNGSHSLTATAYDAAWNAGSKTIQVQVADVVAPTLVITSPGGAPVTGTATVSASAYDAVGVAQLVLSIDGAVVKTVHGAGSISYGWNTASLVEGSAHVLAVTATDAAGNATSATKSVSIRDLNGPSVVITSPGALVTGPVDISVQASDPTGVAQIILYRDGAPVAQRSGASLEHPWDVDSLPLGAQTNWTAVAVDGSGNSASASVTSTVGDWTRPVVSIDRPAPGELVSGLELVQVSASDDRELRRLMLFIDGRLVRSESGAGTLVHVWDAGQRPPGSTSTLWVVAQDEAGNADYWSVTVEIEAEGSRPRVPLGMAPTSPTDDGTLAPGAFADARSRGAEVLYWYQPWADAVSNPNGTGAGARPALGRRRGGGQPRSDPRERSRPVPAALGLVHRSGLRRRLLRLRGRARRPAPARRTCSWGTR